MIFAKVKEILRQYNFYGLTVRRDGDYKLTYTFHSVPYYAVNVTVDVLRVDKERIVSSMTIGGIAVNDEKDLIPTLKTLGRIQHNILYGNKKKKEQ